MQPQQRISSYIVGLDGGNGLWKGELIDMIHQEKWQPGNSRDMTKFAAQLSRYTLVERESVLKERILELLGFSEIQDRFESITPAHRRTLEWVFQDNTSRHWHSFPAWLQRSEKIYWITGKPGSGKSTLMKFLYTDRRMRSNARVWSRSKELVTSGFFFWNSGTRMQMSNEGLLRSLLREILMSRPHLIPSLFPKRWTAYKHFGRDIDSWTWSELTQALQALVSRTSMRFLFFIDGLDEFEGSSDELCKLVLDLANQSKVRLCISSRPWPVFEDAFGSGAYLKMENLTGRDIQVFVVDRFNSSKMFGTMARVFPERATQFIQEITAKSCGVFLWVRIVVESLITGCRDGDSIEDLQKRLNALPADLEELFKKIIQRMDKEHFHDVSQMIQLVEAATTPLSLLDLSMAQEGLDKALTANIHAISATEISYRAEVMRRRLGSRTQGLLEARMYDTFGAAAPVSFLHRTVRDFLRQRAMWECILSAEPDSISIHLRLSGGYLYRVKTMSQGPYMLNEFWTSFLKSVEYLTLATQSTEEEISVSFDELHRAANVLWHQADAQSNSGQTWLESIAFAHTLGTEVSSGTTLWTNTSRSLEESIHPFAIFESYGTEWFPCTNAFEHALRLRLHRYVIARLKARGEISTKLDHGSLLNIAKIQGNELIISLLNQRKFNTKRHSTSKMLRWLRRWST